MVCLAVFGRGPGGGLLNNDHLRQIKNNPVILKDIYMLAGIASNTPVTVGLQNFRYQQTGFADHSFVCPDAFCRRVLPVYVAQFDHNVPQTALNLTGLGQAHIPAQSITARNFIHRNATNSPVYRNHMFRHGPAAGPFVNIAFGIYYTFTSDNFHLVMQIGNNLWVAEIPRTNTAQMINMILSGFNVAPCLRVPNSYEFVDYPIMGLLRTTNTNYAQNLVGAHDLANFQFMCGPCNAAKNDAGVPLSLDTHY